MNAVNIRYVVQQAVSAGTRAGADFHGLRIEYATPGAEGNTHSGWLRATGHTGIKSYADLVLVRGATPGFNGRLRIHSPTPGAAGNRGGVRITRGDSLAASWDGTNYRLNLTMNATHTARQVENAIIALDEFADADVTHENGALGSDTFQVPASDGATRDYNFANGANATVLAFDEASNRLTVNNVVPGVTTVQNIIDAYTGSAYRLTVASGASASDTFTIAAGPHTFTGGLDPNTDDGIDPYIYFHHADDDRAAGIEVYYQIGDDLADVVVRGGTYAKNDGTNASYNESTYVSTSGTQATDLAAGSAQPARPVDGENAVPAGPIEAIIHETHTTHGPHVEIRYNASTDTLDTIAFDLNAGGNVEVEEIVGTDLTARPEAVGFTPRQMYIGFGTRTNVSGQVGVNVDDDGTALGRATTVDFTGAGVSTTFANGEATVNIPGGVATIPAWATGTNYAVGQMVRDAHSRAFWCYVAINNSRVTPAQEPGHFRLLGIYAGDYANNTAYPVGQLVTYNDHVYFTIAAVPGTNTLPPDSFTTAFVQIDGGGSAGIDGITIADEGDDLPTAATRLNFTGSGVTVTGSGADKTIAISASGQSDVTDLSVDNRTGSSLDIASSTGADATVPQSTGTLAGLMTDAQFVKLDGIEPQATQDQTASEIVALLESLADDNRLDFGALKDVPDASTNAKGVIEIADNAQEDAGTDNSLASTPAGVRRTTGPQVSAAERTAGTETSIRRFSPADVSSMVASHGAGLNENQVDARIRALVEAVALIANASQRWPKSKIPNDVVYTAALNAAIAGFQTAAQVTTAIDNALAALDAVVNQGDWAAATAYDLNDLVRNDGGWYIGRRTVTANSGGVTEPGSGSDWETYWRRVGYENGLPSAVTGASVTGDTLTLSRNSGSNPIEVTLPTGGGGGSTGNLQFEELGVTDFDLRSAASYEYAASDPALDLSDVSDDDMLGFAISGVSNSGEGVFIIPASALYSADAGDTVANANRNGDDASIILNFNQAFFGRDSNNRLTFAAQSPAAVDPSSVTVWRVGGPGEANRTRAERITFQAIPNGNNDTEGTPIGTNPISVVAGDGDAEILSNVSGNDFTVAAGTYLVDLHGDFTAGSNNATGKFNIQRASDNSSLEFSSPLDLVNGTVTASAYALIILDEATAINIQYRTVQSSSAIAANWTATFTRWGGGREIRTVQTFDPPELGRHSFDLDGSAANVATGITCPADGWIIAVISAPTASLVGATSFMLAADLRDAGQSSALTSGLYTDGDNQIFLQLAAQTGSRNGNEIIIFHAGTTTDDTGGGSTPTPDPTILRYQITGNQSPEAGNIGGDTYAYEVAISNSKYAAGARIVGYTGAPSTSPSSVSVLATISTLSSEKGSVTIPDPTNLAAGELYTIELQVYKTGQTVGTDTPVAEHDYVITARAAATAAVRLVYVMGADYAAARAAVDLTQNNIGASRASVIGDWTVTGLPAPSGDDLWRLAFVVPAALPQPTTFVASTFDVTNSFNSADRTIGGVSYTIWVSDDDYDDSSNVTITIS